MTRAYSLHTSQPERVGDRDNFVDNVGFSLKNRDNTTWNNFYKTSFRDSHNAKVGHFLLGKTPLLRHSLLYLHSRLAFLGGPGISSCGNHKSSRCAITADRTGPSPTYGTRVDDATCVNQEH